MIGEKQRRFVESAGQQVPAPIQAAIVRLAEAHDYARDMQCDLWDFAVEIDALASLGLSDKDLRGLVAGGYIEHGQEMTKPSDPARRFRPAGSRAFTAKTCFVVTEKGLALTAVRRVGSKLQRAA